MIIERPYGRHREYHVITYALSSGLFTTGEYLFGENITRQYQYN